MKETTTMRYRLHIRILLLLLSLLTGIQAYAQTCSSYADRTQFQLPKHFVIFSDTRNPCDWGEPAQGTVGHDIYYGVTLTDTMNLVVHTLGSDIYGTEINVTDPALVTIQRSLPKAMYYSFLELENLWQNDYLASQDTYILNQLLPGTYIITVHGIPVSNATVVNGQTRTTFIAWHDGDLLDMPQPEPISGMRTLPKELGSFDTDFIYADTVSTLSYPNSYDYEGADVFYHFSLDEEMQVTIDFDSQVSKLHLFDSNGWELYRLCYPLTMSDACYLQVGSYTLVVEELADAQPSELSFRIEGQVEEEELPQQVNGPDTPTGGNYITHRVYTDATGVGYNDETTFYDGLGRSIETVQAGASPSSGDIVTMQTYNLSGLPAQTWHPIAIGNNSGHFVAPGNFSSQAIQTDANPYTLLEYELSPLNREVRQTAPGSAWHSNDKSVQTEYICNGTNANVVRYYTISADGNSLCLADNAPEGTYSGTRVTDEDGRTLETYKDMLGNIVLERRNDGTQQLDTYYVYDNRNQLRVVIPPLAASELFCSGNASTWQLATDVTLRQYAYVYKYDAHGRLSEKRLPGCAWMQYWYDRQGRLAYSQDGVQSESERAMFYLYDGFGREIIRGECDESSIDDCELRDNLAHYTGTGLLAGYTSTTTLDDPTLLSVNYYDSYDFVADQNLTADYTPDTSDASYQHIWNNGTNQPFATGLLTGSLVYALGAQNNFPTITSVYYYDEEGRPVQAISTNHLGGIDKTFTTYDFRGHVISRKIQHAIPQAQNNNYQSSIINYLYTYDAWGRPLATTLSYDGEEAVTIEDNTYDALGRLSQTTRNSQSGLTTQYAYNIRDWVTQIVSSVFAENLYYNTSYNGSTPQWGGNISAMAWQAPYSSAMGGGQAGALRSYNFVYDGMSRLLSAAYSEGGVNNNRYTTAYTYDPMGNILTLQRSGLLDDGEYGTLDNLNYEYEGNQLIKVDDSNIDEPTYVHAIHFTDGADEDVEYEYNANGSLVEDINKGLSIEYNVLNLPSTIYHYPAPVSSPETVKYVYAADGRKLHVEYYDNRILRPYPIYDGEGHVIGMEVPQKTPELMRDYCGDFIYEDGQLKRILFDGGYITPKSDGTAEYHFYVKDHLGNIRAVVSQNDSIEEINHYYPYGSLFGESTGLSNETQPYKYTGKELDRMHGLDMHDHGARWSDTNIGRWHVVDPLAEDYTWLSSYVLCGNNPIKYVDPTGMIIDLSEMSKEELEKYTASIQELRQGSTLFDSMYTALEDSKEVYTVNYGNPISENGQHVDGQFVLNEDGGGSLTFTNLKSEINSNVFSEEFFHAYQHDNRKGYASGSFNREFEAKLFATLVGSESFGYREYKGMRYFQEAVISGAYDNTGNTLTGKSITSTTFLQDYRDAANIYAVYNRDMKIGNSNYKAATKIRPYSLLKIISQVYP